MNELTQFCQEILESRVFISKIKKNPFYNELISKTSFLNNANISQRAWHWFSQCHALPVCPQCKIKNLKWNADIKAYRQFCSVKCSTNSNHCLEKRKETSLKKYGVEHPSSHTSFRDKIKKTSLEKYGVEHYSKTSEFKSQTRKTNLERFGTEYASQADDVKKKTKDYFMQQFGVTNPMKCDEIKEKVYSTNMQRYGVAHVLQNVQILKKVKETNRQKYGVDYTLQCQEIRERGKETTLEKYGVENYSQSHISQETLKRLKDKAWLEEQHKTLTIGEIANSLGVSSSNLGKIFKKHKIEVNHFFKSSLEREISNLLKSNYSGTILENQRNIVPPYELDFYLPDLNLAIEINGVYYHSELLGKDRNYHNNKLEKCKTYQIKLLQILDTELLTNKEIVVSRILNELDCSKKLGARKLFVCEVNTKDKNKFLNDNHIQGSCTSSVNLGLYHEEELLSIMTFGASRYNKDIDWELLRFANKIGYSIVGGASKLLSHFRQYHKGSIISYSDRRWSKGDLYKALGFSFSHTAPPNYHYFYKGDTLNLQSRVQLQKHKLESKIDYFDSSLTEWENMKANGYNRIWDCGNDVWFLK